MQVEDLALGTRRQLDTGRAWPPLGLVGGKRSAGITRRSRELPCKNIPIFNRRSRALR